MLKLLLLVLVIWLIIGVLRQRAVRRRAAVKTESSQKIPDMVRCETCGVHLPQNEALIRSGRHYCCEAHLQANDQQ